MTTIAAEIQKHDRFMRGECVETGAPLKSCDCGACGNQANPTVRWTPGVCLRTGRAIANCRCVTCPTPPPAARDPLRVDLPGRVADLMPCPRSGRPAGECGCIDCHVPVKPGECADGSPVMTAPLPPLGVMPLRLHRERRGKDLAAAIGRYLDAGKLVPPEWLDELDDIVRDIHQAAEGETP